MKLSKKALLSVALVSLLITGCPRAYQNLAVASDAVAHSLKNVQDAISLAVQNGVMTTKERDDFNVYLVKAAVAGLALDGAIRKASASGAPVTEQVNAFLDAFRQLNTEALGIRDNNTRLAVSIALSSTQSSIAIIAAVAGGK